MRVLHLASWHPNRVHPQLGNFVRRHIEAATAHGQHMAIHAWPMSGGRGQQSPPNPWKADDPPSLSTCIHSVKDALPRRWRVERKYHELCRCFDAPQHRPDIVHLHIAAEAARPAAHWARRWGVPLIVSENWTAYHAEHGRTFLPSERKAAVDALRTAALLLPVSEHLGRAMSGLAAGAPQKVVPNVVQSIFQPPVKGRDSSGPLKLLHVSSLVEEHKNLRGTLRAVKRALERGADLELDIYGGAGPGAEMVAEHQAWIRQCGIGHAVRIHGPLSADGVAEVMQESDAFVLFSRYENLPCVLLEAWCTGMPVLASDVGGTKEHMAACPELGMLVASEDEEALSNALVQWAMSKANGRLAPSESILTYARARFTEEAVGRAIQDAYESVLR